LCAACAHKEKRPDLGLLYNTAAQNIGPARNPVIVIPGILGSKLVDTDTDQKVWGAFTYGATDPDFPEGARLFALPMKPGVPLSDLTDNVQATDVLDTLTIDVGLLRGLEIGAYIDIMRTLAAGKYRDENLGRVGAVDYGGLHYTCFQFAYDWRRDISEQSVKLHELILDAQYVAQQETGASEPPKVDVVAHSMGGLVLRYYLRYGPHPLADDGSLPPLTWEGAEYVERAILIGTPSAGSVLSLRQMVEGVNYAAITPTYRPAVLGTLPSIYQLLPRVRHGVVIDEATGEPIDFMNPTTWDALGWGLLDPKQERTLQWLLPEVESAEERRAIAADQLAKCLARADQLFRALDVPSAPPAGLEITLIAGDVEPTPSVLAVDTTTGDVHISEFAPGDDTVTRQSALMDERQGQAWTPRLQSPVAWRSVHFLPATHLGLTAHPGFADNVLYLLLEEPRP
jgi:pimeloyl-ACP methyl ester carboxylesterase